MSDLDDVCRRALVEWGRDAQTMMPMEEMGELTAAISQYERGRIDEDEIAEEMADVYICLRQLELLVGPDVVEGQLAKKIDALDERLSDD